MAKKLYQFDAPPGHAYIHGASTYLPGDTLEMEESLAVDPRLTPVAVGDEANPVAVEVKAEEPAEELAEQEPDHQLADPDPEAEAEEPADPYAKVRPKKES